ncbi:MAG: glutamyl-tRNA reductase [Anaerolineae bacterium]|nr:glutamyl-tRNA reductase [Anaerolineae bacterium]
MPIVLVGLNHKVAPVEVRERLAFSPATLKPALARFHPDDGDCPHASEGVILSTCNRLEIYTLSPSPQEAEAAACAFLEACHGQCRETFRPFLYTYANEEAVAHLFSVAAGLDSLVLGEFQILGQVTDALEACLECKTAGKVLTTLFRSAVETGKRARTETTISQGATSVSHVAVELARRIFGDLDACQVLLVGAGEMAELAARTLSVYGVKSLSILNRMRERAERLATEFNARPLGWDQFDSALRWADIVIASTSAPQAIFRPDNVRQALSTRRNRPLFFIDIAVPRNVDPEVDRLKGVYRYDIDDLKAVVETSLAERQREIPKVEAIVAEQQGKFMAWLCSLEVMPTIVDMRREMDRIRQGELEHTLSRLGNLSARDREIIQGMTQRIINKILHQPTIRLKEHANVSDGYYYAATVRDLFGLDGSVKSE